MYARNAGNEKIQEEGIMIRTRSAASILGLFLILGATTDLYSQSVQAGIFSAAGDTLKIRAKSDGNIIAGSFSGMIVTIRWLASYGADLGAVKSDTMTTGESFGIAKQGGEVTNGIYEYQAFACAPLAGTINWSAAVEYPLFSIPVIGGVGSRVFDLANDAYTSSHNGDWYFEIGGGDVTASTPFYHASITNVPTKVAAAPFEFTLAHNYPNPFNPSTTIQFTVPKDGRAVVRVYNILGQEVATLLDRDLVAGVYHQVVFDASRLASGIYFSSVEFDGKRITKKMLLLK